MVGGGLAPSQPFPFLRLSLRPCEFYLIKRLKQKTQYKMLSLQMFSVLYISCNTILFYIGFIEIICNLQIVSLSGNIFYFLTYLLSKSKQCCNAKLSEYYFHVKMKIMVDFHSALVYHFVKKLLFVTYILFNK